MQNTTNSNYERGSVWRKWDLHIHTPASFFWKGAKKLNEMSDDEKQTEIETFISTINESDVSVFCLMDYWTFDWYLEMKKYLIKNPDKLKKTIFPGIELRIESPVDYRLNIHCILSDKLSDQELQDFKSELHIRSIDKKLSDDSLRKFAKSLDESKARIHGFNNPDVLTDDKLFDLGAKTAEITKDSLEKAFTQIPSESGFIILPYDTSDGLSKLDWERHPHADNYFMQTAHIFETRDEKNIDLISGYRTDTNEKYFENFYKTLGNKSKPCISGSDAHKFSEYGKFPSDKITWIKADPTFEGLKQIIFEPQERVRIQANNPEYDFNKPYFDRISIKNEVPIPVYDDGTLKIAQNEIKLNKNLVAIIGGRGDGKSTIINYLANCFGKITLNDTNFTNHDSFEVEHHKINEINITPDDKINYIASEKLNNHLDFVFISQGELKSKLQKPDDLSDTLKALLHIHEKGFSKVLENEIYSVNEKIASLEKWKLQKDEQNELINSQAFHQRVVDVNSTLLNGLKNSQNKLNIEQYNVNLTKFSDLQKEINLAVAILNKINSFTQEISSLIEKNHLDNPAYSLPDFSSYKSGIKFHIQDLETKASSIKTKNESIKTDLLTRGVSGDLTSLVTNIEKYQNIIKNTQSKILDINQKDSELNRLKSLRSEFGNRIKFDYENQKNNIDNGWENFLSHHDESNKKLINDIILSDKKINITGKINFNLEEFYKLLSESLNKNTYKDVDELKSQYKIKSLDDLSNFIENEFNAKLDSLNHKKQEFIDLFFLTEKRSAYLKTEADIKYDGKYLNQLSAGQKGTAYLRIQLANSAFSTPIIFDQPEDDLDNKFIVGELINIFKELKKYRQIIIVTHNANLVVNADAEQVIVAQNENETLSYISGSLEDTKIQQHVCDILEGGVTAFEKRKNKYNLK